MIKCGILLNVRDNYFFPYIDWIVEKENNSDFFCLSGIVIMT